MHLTWRANYNDNTFLRQDKNAYEKIDRTKLDSFDILNGEQVVFRLFLEEGRKLIYRRRVHIDSHSIVLGYFYIVGWQQNVKGTNIQTINYVYPERTIKDEFGKTINVPIQVVSAGRWDGGPPTLMKEEKVANQL